MIVCNNANLPYLHLENLKFHNSKQIVNFQVKNNFS